MTITKTSIIVIVPDISVAAPKPHIKHSLHSMSISTYFGLKTPYGVIEIVSKLSPIQHKAITSNNVDILLTTPFWANLDDIWSKVRKFITKQM